MFELLVFVVLYLFGALMVIFGSLESVSDDKLKKIGIKNKKELIGYGLLLLIYSIVWYYLVGIKDPWWDQLLILTAVGLITKIVGNLINGLFKFVTETLPSLNRLIKKEFPELKGRVKEIDKKVGEIDKRVYVLEDFKDRYNHKR